MLIDIIGAPVDYGAGRRGVDMGPAAVRHAGLGPRIEALGHEVRDRGNLAVPLREHVELGDPRMKYLDAILSVERDLAQAVAETVTAGRLPVVIGGDHSIALGSVAGVASVRPSIGLIWVDQHGDFNTHETTPSGNVHGMPLAALCGYGHPRLVGIGGWKDAVATVRPENVAIVGARELDRAETELLRGSGVTVLSMATVDRYGISLVMEHAIEIATAGTEGIHVSFDLDVVDPELAPGVGTPGAGGLTIREAHLAMEMLAASGKVIALDMVEVNPILDERNRTAELAVDLALSALGKRVWHREHVPALDVR